METVTQIKLQEVFIHKGDTCLSYALKRIGLSWLALGLDDSCRLSDSNFKWYEFPDIIKNDSLMVGDLLIWTTNERWTEVPVGITENGELIKNKVLVRRHIAVYEGNNVISDLTRNFIEGSNLPALRIRNLSEVKEPQFVLR